jgi:ArsR family transcriptional regulator
LLSFRRDGLWVYYFFDNNETNRHFADFINQLDNGSTFFNDRNRAKQVLKERNVKTRRFFNTIAGDWDTLKKNIFGDFDISGIIVNSIENCETAVDLGCGTGDLLFLLKDRAKKVIGVDSSPGMLEESRKRFISEENRVECRLGELEHIPLRDEEADVAIINMSLHHLSVPEIGIRESYRILKPDDTFILADFEKHSVETMRSTYGDRWLGFSQNEIENWLTQTGFSIIDIQQHELRFGLKVNIYFSKKNG